jgi:hypothetical protein
MPCAWRDAAQPGWQHASTKQSGSAVLFARQLREGVRRGDITCTVRIWQRPRVRVGGRYRLGAGQVEVDSMHEISLSEVTGAVARRCGFKGVVDLLKVARHGRGDHIYLIHFHYIETKR